jgi:hypothetical protein
MCTTAKSALACFETSVAPRPKNSHSDKKDALFRLDTQITISSCSEMYKIKVFIQWKFFKAVMVFAELVLGPGILKRL